MPTGADSGPASFLSWGGGQVAFTAQTPAQGRELYVSDGTNDGTRLVTDLCPGACSSSVIPFGAVGPHLLFFGREEENGNVSLWATRGTEATTVRLVQRAAFGFFDHRLLVRPLGRLFFTLDDGVHGTEFWVSDGTAAGTRLVVDLQPGSSSSLPENFVVHRGRLYFSAVGRQGLAIYSSDGTAAGTRRELAPPALRSIEQLISVGRNLFFVASDANLNWSMWRLGPRGDALKLKTSSVANRPVRLFRAGTRAIFLGSDATRGQELFGSDGSVQGTVRLTDFAPSEIYSHISTVTPFNLGSRAVVPLDDGVHGEELWVTDGTPAGTRLLRDLSPGRGEGFRTPIAPRGNKFLFLGETPQRGPEPWVTDGTPAGTLLLKDVCPGSCGVLAQRLSAVVVGPQVYFSLDSQQILVSDGSRAGTRLLPAGSFVTFGTDLLGAAAGASLVFAGREESTGVEPWVSEGSEATTRPLADLNTDDVGGSSPGFFLTHAGKTFFRTRLGGNQFALWMSDGTAQGTERILGLPADLDPALSRENSARVGDSVVFIGRRGEPFFDEETWSVSASSGLAVRLTSAPLSVRMPPAAFDGKVFFLVNAEGGGSALWRTDGTAAGTEATGIDLPFGVELLGATPDRLIFSQPDPLQRNTLLYSTDGTSAPQLLRASVPSSDEEIDEGRSFLFRDRLYYFSTRQVPFSNEPTVTTLWSTDGTPEGTHQLVAPTMTFPPVGQVQVGRDHYFLGLGGFGLQPEAIWSGDADGVEELVLPLEFSEAPLSSLTLPDGRTLFDIDHVIYASDGTAAGTAPYLPTSTLSLGSTVTLVRHFAGKVIFTAFPAFEASTLYETDGTAAGTRALRGHQEIDLTPNAPTVLFAARDPLVGTELWRLDP